MVFLAYSPKYTPWATCGRRFGRVAIRAIQALLVSARSYNKNEQKHLEILLSEKKAPAQNEAFPDLVNRQSPRFLVSSSLIKCNRISIGIPAPRAQNPPTSLLGGFAHWKRQSLKPHDVAEGSHSSDGHGIG